MMTINYVFLGVSFPYHMWALAVISIGYLFMKALKSTFNSILHPDVSLNLPYQSSKPTGLTIDPNKPEHTNVDREGVTSPDNSKGPGNSSS